MYVWYLSYIDDERDKLRFGGDHGTRGSSGGVRSPHMRNVGVFTPCEVRVEAEYRRLSLD
jgi:hypothetical protein